MRMDRIQVCYGRLSGFFLSQAEVDVPTALVAALLESAFGNNVLFTPAARSNEQDQCGESQGRLHTLLKVIGSRLRSW